MNRKMKRLCATLLLLGTLCCAHAAEKSPTIVYINGSKYYIHTVQAGETLYSLAREYGVGEQVIVENNPSVAQGLKADARLKIPFMAEAPEAKPSERKLKKTFDMHYVRKGETLYAISRRYAISIQTILEDNPNLDPTHLRPDERILIRRKESGKGSEAQRQAEWEAYRTALNSVAEKGYAYHIVRPGETFYSLSRRFGTTEEELRGLGVGFRAPFILDAIEKRSVLDEIDGLGYEEAEKRLMTIKGIGSKVASCILIFSYQKREGFPLDVWMKKVMAEYYPGKDPSYFHPYEALSQQYLFSWIRAEG